MFSTHHVLFFKSLWAGLIGRSLDEQAMLCQIRVGYPKSLWGLLQMTILNGFWKICGLL